MENEINLKLKETDLDLLTETIKSKIRLDEASAKIHSPNANRNLRIDRLKIILSGLEEIKTIKK